MVITFGWSFWNVNFLFFSKNFFVIKEFFFFFFNIIFSLFCKLVI